MTHSHLIRPFILHPKHIFRISRATQEEVKNVLLEIRYGNHVGYGEGSPDPFYQESYQKASVELERLIGFLPGELPSTPEAIGPIWQVLRSKAKSFSALAALDIALWDLAAGLANMPLHRFCNRPVRKEFLTSCTVALDSVEKMVEKIQELKGYPIVKVKLDKLRNVEVIRALRNNFDGVIRVDANCSWDSASTLKYAEEMAKLGVEFIEQPLPPEEIYRMPEVKKYCALPLMADESSVHAEDVEKCADCFHGINIKLMKCGGLTPALEMYDLAVKHGLKTMVGCMLESNVGISAGLVVGGLADYADLDGSWLLADDPFSGHSLDRGVFTLDDHPGLGVRLK